jgi:ABC-2 type transport system ATP-binding protein
MSAVVLHAQDLAKSYGRHHVLQGVTFSVERGTLAGIVGENGAGKSTLLRILAGELRPDRGSVVMTGTLGYCPQAAVLNAVLTVDQHLDYFRAAYHLSNLRRAGELVERLNFGEYRHTPVGSLSGGTQQKLNLTLALMHEPDILLLDEPYQGFDWETYLRFWDLADELRQRGCAILVISHLVFDQQRFDRLYHLEHGRLAPVAASPEAGTVAAQAR